MKYQMPKLSNEEILRLQSEAEVNRALNLLSVVADPQYAVSALQKQGVGGVGTAQFVLSQWIGLVVHPDLLPILQEHEVETMSLEMDPSIEGLPDWFMWSRITWSNGRVPQPEKLIELLETEEKVVETGDWEVFDFLSQLGGKLKAMIVMVEPEKGLPPGKKIRFDAVIKVPQMVQQVRKHRLTPYGDVVVSQADEVRFTKLKGIAYGNQPFEGMVNLELEQDGREKWGHKIIWYAPLTPAEETAREEQNLTYLVGQCRREKIVLAGWRYTDTANPVVLSFDEKSQDWIIGEFFKDRGQIFSRSGHRSNKIRPNSLQIGEIDRKLSQYQDATGFPVEVDRKLKTGQSLLDALGLE